MITQCKSPLFIFAFSLVLSACGGGGDSGFSSPNISDTSTPSSSSPTSVAELRQQELDVIDTTLRANHPDMFFRLNETDWQNQMASIEGQTESISALGFLFETTKMVATLGDQHTYLIMPDEFLKQFPVEVWWDGDRAIVVKATTLYEQFLGHELSTIDGKSMLEIRDTVMNYLASENEYWKVGISPLYLNYAEVMEWEGLIASADVASMVFISQEGESTTLDVPSAIGEPQFIAIEETQDVIPAYYQNINDNYAVQLIEDDLYIQYNSAFDMFPYDQTALLADIQFIINNNVLENIIVDIRFNLGGQIDHFVPVIDYLASTEFNNPEDLFVLTGRRTFSSGVGATYSFRDRSNATFVGMPTGGKPNGFSNVVGLGMPYTQSALFFSLDYLEITDGDPETFIPDHLTPFTQQDFIQGMDPALSLIKSRW